MTGAVRDDAWRIRVDPVVDDLRRIVGVLYAHSRRVERMFRLTSAQAWLIMTLSGKTPCKVSELARAMHLEPSAVVRIVGRLEGRGLVVRTRTSDDHGIAKVALTHVGMKMAGRIPAIPQERLLKGLTELPARRLRAVSEGLEFLTRILGAGEVAPLLFFAPVANLPAGAAGSPEADAIPGAGRGGHGR